MQKSNFAGGSRQEAAGFSIGNLGYILTGYNGVNKSDMWLWDQVTDTWSQAASLPATSRKDATAASVNGKGYLFFGSYSNQVWEYDPGNNSWMQKNNFPGLARRFSTAISNGSKIYIVAGDPGYAPYLNDLWEYDPTTDTWLQKAAFPGGQRSGGTGFAIGNKIYYGTGNDNSSSYATKDLWEYDPATNTWTPKAAIPTSVSIRRVGAAFTLNNLGYIGLGWSGNISTTYNYDFWEYNCISDTWIQRVNFIGQGAYTPVGFAINNKGYFGTGGTNNGYTDQFWEYTPCDSVLTGVSCEGLGNKEVLKNNNGISVFPNPTSGYFKLELNKQLEYPQSTMITDLLGKTILQIPNTKNYSREIDLSDLANGVYFIKINYEDKTIIQKVIKN